MKRSRPSDQQDAAAYAWQTVGDPRSRHHHSQQSGHTVPPRPFVGGMPPMSPPPGPVQLPTVTHDGYPGDVDHMPDQQRHNQVVLGEADNPRRRLYAATEVYEHRMSAKPMAFMWTPQEPCR